MKYTVTLIFDSNKNTPRQAALKAAEAVAMGEITTYVVENNETNRKGTIYLSDEEE